MYSAEGTQYSQPRVKRSGTLGANIKKYFSPGRAEYIALSGLASSICCFPRVALRFTLGCGYSAAPRLLSNTMITFLLLLHLSLPNLIAQRIARQVLEDSSAASHMLLIPYRAEIDSAARRESLPAALIAALIQEESRFEPWATRSEPRYVRNRRVLRAAARYAREHHGGANAYTEFVDRARSYGLMQVMGETAREQGFAAPFLAELYVPKNSIAHGATLLAQLLRRYHSDTLAAISAYNQGSARRTTSGRHRGVFANARYVYRVVIAWRAYQPLFANGASPYEY